MSGDDSVPQHTDTPSDASAASSAAASTSDQGFDTMSLATLDALRPTARPLIAAAPAASAPTPSASATTTPPPRAVPEGTEARGFALYVGIDELKAADAGTDLGEVVQAL